MGDVVGSRPDLDSVTIGTIRFEELYDRFFARIYNYIFYQVHDREQADELVSEVFTKIYRGLSRFDGNKAPFSAWLYAIARNTVRDSRRSRRYPVALPMDLLPELASTLRSPEDSLLLKERVESVLRAVNRLGKREREIVGMRMGARISNREIAGILHMKEGTVAVCLFRAIRRIRKLLLEDER